MKHEHCDICHLNCPMSRKVVTIQIVAPKRRAKPEPVKAK